MKPILASTALIAASFFATSASAAEWDIDTSHSSISFKVKHMMVTDVRGEISGVGGTVTFDPKNPTEGSVKVAADVSTIDTNDAKRDGHLQSPDFFDVAKHPKATFESTKITKKGDRYEVHGKLTIRGKTKPVILTATISDPVQAWGKTIVGISASTTINRQDFGVSWNKTLDKGGLVVGNDVQITIDLELNKKGKEST
jgi:polyisoprenoid-binding protein YceI